MRNVIIDFHAHAVPPWVIERREEINRNDECFSLLYSDPRAKLATAEDIIRSMDECEIDKTVILNLSWQSHDLCVRTNDYILESVARYQERLIGFCAIQASSKDAAIAEIERCARNGARGIGEIRPDMPGFDLRKTGLLTDVVGALIEHRLILLFHASEPVGHTYNGKGTATPELLYPFIKSFPDLIIICAHWGGGLPFYALMPEVADVLHNVFFDSAATPFLYRRDIFRLVRDTVGSGKILFGSDYPLLSPVRILSQIESAGLSENEKAEVLGGNAECLLSSTGE
jgi:predicted TIM-barrel fold metal-dependent hydrolase